MEFWKPDNVIKIEQSAAKRFHIHKAQNLVKLLEISSALILVLWSIACLPIALKISIDWAKQASALLLTTPSVFLIGNAIVVTLVAQFQSLTNSGSDLYDEFVTESRSRSEIQPQDIEKVIPLLDSPAVVAEGEVTGCCRRTQSERVVSVVRCDVKKKELRKTRTEKCGGMKMIVKTAASGEVDELSGDEFRRRVESFIEKQQRFIRDENMALVVST